MPSPDEIIVGADGALWFTASPACLGKITTTGVMTLWNISWNNIAVGPDKMMWYAGYTGSYGVVGQFQDTQQLSTFNVPAPAAPGEPGQVITGPDGALWFVDSSNYIVRLPPGH
jgi:streptogramin lyase